MKRILMIILLSVVLLPIFPQSIEDIIFDIYEQLAENDQVDFEDLQTELHDLHEYPVNINAASYDDLSKLRFLTSQQIDNLLLFVRNQPLKSIHELYLVPGFKDYEIRNLEYFVKVEPLKKKDRPYFREIFHYGKNELSLRTDMRNPENGVENSLFGQLRYRFNYNNKVQFGFSLKHPVSSGWRDWQYGGYLELKDIGHLKTIEAGNYQAHFGLGLVVGQAVHAGKSSYLASIPSGNEGLRKYSSVSSDFDYFHGTGATFNFDFADITAFYSIRRDEDTLWHHAIGLNTTFRYKQFKIGLTALENIYSLDSNQVIIGINSRYNFGKVDLYGEFAAAQDTRWGFATEIGMNIHPIEGLDFVALYRYFSPYFHNRYANGFAETNKVNDENGFYLGVDVNMLKRWRFAFYADGFKFYGPKYGIPFPSNGYDVMFRADYHINDSWNMYWKLRAKRKGEKDTYYFRYRLNYENNGLRLISGMDVSLNFRDSVPVSSLSRPSEIFGMNIYQDIQYSFPRIPIVLQARIQGFDIRQWDNRIYIYENDVLYSFSIPSAYGVGGRFYLNIRWNIIKQLSLYLKVSETVYTKEWYLLRKMENRNRTDIHLTFRSTF